MGYSPTECKLKAIKEEQTWPRSWPNVFTVHFDIIKSDNKKESIEKVEEYSMLTLNEDVNFSDDD